MKILFVPSLRKGNGTGHLKRCDTLAAALGGYLFLPGYTRDGYVVTLRTDQNRVIDGTETDIFTDGAWDLIVLDNRHTGPDLMQRLLLAAPVLALDEGGPLRGRVTWLVDTLRFPEQKPLPNYLVPGLVVQNKPSPVGEPDSTGENRISDEARAPNETHAPNETRRVLVSFGGEDPSALTEKFIARYRLLNTITDLKFTLVSPARAIEMRSECPEWEILPPVPDLQVLIAKSDVVITSFGLTLWEALRFGKQVLLINATRYHARLTRLNGFESLGTGHVRGGALKRRLQHSLSNNGTALPKRQLYADGQTLVDLIQAIVPGRERCPVCGSLSRRSIDRQASRTFFECLECSITYQVRCLPVSIRYDRDYFFTGYTRQYGKTYLEDFDHIAELGRKRLEQLRSLTAKTLTQERPGLLDIGCAYGPFLWAAHEAGFSVTGLEISREAAAYVREELGFPVINAAFEQYETTQTYDVVSLWFVIEHFTDMHNVLMKLRSITAAKGWLVFSTPNGRGWSARFRKSDFYQASPEDHYTIWNPRSARRVLRRYGFVVKRIRITGIHPDRVPFLRIFRYFLPASLVASVGRLLRLGDTFEVYAQAVGVEYGEG